MKYYLIVDVETSMKGRVIDFSAVLVDSSCEIIEAVGILVYGKFQREKLFHRENTGNPIWKKRNLKRRMKKYYDLIEKGDRIIASVPFINSWLFDINSKYNPELTAYNLSYDFSKCRNTGIKLDIFINFFCLWHCAANKFGHTDKYLQYVLDNHAFNARTKNGNMTYQTNAEVMASFVSEEYLGKEPHTALEDIYHFELPILKKLIEAGDLEDNRNIPYNWQDFQVRDFFQPKGKNNV